MKNYFISLIVICLLCALKHVSAQSDSWRSSFQYPRHQHTENYFIATQGNQLEVFDRKNNQEKAVQFDAFVLPWKANGDRILISKKDYLLWSDDFCDSWDSVQISGALNTQSTVIMHGDSILILAGSFLFRTTDLGQNWTTRTFGTNMFKARHHGSQLLYFGVDSLFISTDFGATHTAIKSTGPLLYADIHTNGFLAQSATSPNPFTCVSTDGGSNWDTISRETSNLITWASNEEIVYLDNSGFWQFMNINTRKKCMLQFNGKMGHSLALSWCEREQNQLFIAGDMINALPASNLICFEPTPQVNSRIKEEWTLAFSNDWSGSMNMYQAPMVLNQNRILLTVFSNGRYVLEQTGDSASGFVYWLIDTNANLIERFQVPGNAPQHYAHLNPLPEQNGFLYQHTVRHLQDPLRDTTFQTPRSFDFFVNADTSEPYYRQISLLNKDLNITGSIRFKSSAYINIQFAAVYKDYFEYTLTCQGSVNMIDSKSNINQFTAGSYNFRFSNTGEFLGRSPSIGSHIDFFQLPKGQAIITGNVSVNQKDISLYGTSYTIKNPNNFKRFFTVFDSSEQLKTLYLVNDWFRLKSLKQPDNRSPINLIQIQPSHELIIQNATTEAEVARVPYKRNHSPIFSVDSSGGITYLGGAGISEVAFKRSNGHFLMSILSYDSTNFDPRGNRSWFPTTFYDHFIGEYDHQLNLIDSIGPVGGTSRYSSYQFMDDPFVYFHTQPNWSDFELPGGCHHPVDSAVKIHFGKFRILDNPASTAQELSVPKLIPYPNPVINYLNLTIPELELQQIQIVLYDIQGRMIREVQAESENGVFKVDLSGLEQAYYWVEVRSGDYRQGTLIYKR